jgi:hypothetical protein
LCGGVVWCGVVVWCGGGPTNYLVTPTRSWVELGCDNSSLNLGDISDLSFEQICERFQINGEIWEQKLTSVFGDLAKILEHFETSFQFQKDFETSQSKLEYYFRMLIKLSTIFKQGNLNFNGKIEKIFYYYLSGNSINVEMAGNEMILRTQTDINLEPFSMIKLKFDFFVRISEMLRFSTEENLKAEYVVEIDFPPFYRFQSLLVQNFLDKTVFIPAISILGRFIVEGENHDLSLVARHIPRDQSVNTAEKLRAFFFSKNKFL